ncbi:hypothetical protein [Paenibacillus sp. 1P07SE]|uniref:hypothetical protein n=1 Tax=Paenibacillus sp. 1P07SE TaxID=3132209 RepID=UPI0039A68529
MPPTPVKPRIYISPGGWVEIDTLSQKQYEAERTGEQPYTHEQIRHVQDLADTVGVYAPLLVNPGKGAFSSAEITADQAARQLRFVYPEYTVTQSAGDLRPLQGDRAPDETLFLPGGRAEWFTDEQEPGAWYLQRGMSHVVLQANGEWNADKLLTIVATTKDYLFALQAAQKYASAWADRDPERGLQWVTEAWQSGKDPLELDAHFRGTSNPHHMTFELNGLRQVDSDQRTTQIQAVPSRPSLFLQLIILIPEERTTFG